MSRQCVTGKVRHANLENAKIAARASAVVLNREGKLADTLYAYRCPKCRGGWHLTRQAAWEGNVLAFTAPPEALQRWAITGEAPENLRP